MDLSPAVREPSSPPSVKRWATLIGVRGTHHLPGHTAVLGALADHDS
ncbi:MAG TPA: hypothetical protein VNF71_00660 [Acidimicrobiales bacterium]|nr:hypothetical protein [Acidimicrobiales bacterium]